MLNQFKSIFFFVFLFSLSTGYANPYFRKPACHKSYNEHHLGFNYGLGFNLNKGLIHKFSLGYQRERVKCNSKINEPSKNLLWFDLAPNTFRKFGYSRTWELEDFFYYHATDNFDRKYEFWGKIVHATVFEAGIGRERYEEEDDTKRKTILRLSPKLDFRFWDRFEVSPYYLMDLSIRKPRFHHEAGVKLGIHFGIRKERSPDSYRVRSEE